MKITYNENPVNMGGEQLNAGECFPNFAATANDMSYQKQIRSRILTPRYRR